MKQNKKGREKKEKTGAHTLTKSRRMEGWLGSFQLRMSPRRWAGTEGGPIND